jgi:photosystem II stability/assembly factor-like uncharacterized protein
MLKYALRYAPLLILALLLVSLRFYMEGNAGYSGQGKQNPAFLPRSALSLVLYSIVAQPDGDIWAVGGSFSTQPATPGTSGNFPVPSRGIILHYSNNGWSAVRVAGQLRLPLLSVSLDSPEDGWAVGWAGTLVHYDGYEWSTRPGLANSNQNLLGVAMLSPTDGWAVGYSGTILHYDGKQWMQVPGPTTVDLHGVAFSSPEEGWAVGDSGTLLHYRNGMWSIVSPAPVSSTLNSLIMLSTNEGWAVGNQGTILHYRDGIWENVHPASYYQNPTSYPLMDFSGVAMSSIRSGWIAGGQHLLTYSSETWVEPGNVMHSLNEAYPISNLSLDAVALSSTGEIWVVGTIANDDPKTYSSIGVILHYHTSRWDVFPIFDPVPG